MDVSSLPLCLDRLYGISSLLTIGYQDLSPGVKWLGHEVYRLLPCSAKVKNVWSYASSTQIGLHDVLLN
jgi:hypothetical protein